MRLLVIIVSLCLSMPLFAQETLPVRGGTVTVQKMLSNLDEPWAVAFLPGGGYLVTERAGALIHVAGGKRTEVLGVPKVFAKGQGGLLDVVAARDFAQSRDIFLSYAEPDGRAAGTALAVAKLSPDNTRLTGLRVLFRQENKTGAGQHFGSRIVEAPDGTLFLTVGERGDADLAQDTFKANGSMIRINRDGSVPSDNPFVAGGGLPQVYSYGHRNPQGAALDEDGNLWTVEHGARGGDEINRPEAGKNYGWPVISYGRHYIGLKIGEGTSKPGMEQPIFYWDPSIAPSGMMIYTGGMFPDWRGDIFVGSLKFDFIARLERSGGTVKQAEELFRDRFERIRDVRQAPDGSIWFLSVGDGALYRISR